MSGPTRYQELVTERIGAVLAAARADFGGLDPEIDSLLRNLGERATTGGKGTRSAFAHLGWRAAGGEECAATSVNVGAAFELLHVSALVHDDVIDGAAARRGRATVHVEMAERHRDDGWSGEVRRTAEGIAVLSGNMLWAAAQTALGPVNSVARAEWDKVQMEVNLGQFLDLMAAAERRVDSRRVHSVMELKTARYTAERPLRMGAAATGRAEEPLVDALGRFGNLVGVAFQVRDDVLGVFGDSDVTGKPTGNDLREGKATLLLARSVESGDTNARKLFSRVGAPDLHNEEIEQMKDVMRRSGTLQWAEETAVSYVEQAVDLLARLNISADVRDELAESAWTVVKRDR